MNIEDVISLTNNDECGHIEYKREWYINDNTVLGNQKRWGEIIKDIVAIANANLDSVGMDRYIIFGFDESEKKFYNTKITIDEFNKIKKQIKEKINKFVSGDIDILFYHFYHEGCFIFLFKIKQHNCLFELKNDIQTKTLVYKKGTVLTRGIETAGKSDSIGPMSPDDIIKYKSSLSFMFKTISPESLPKIKSISETIKIYLENSNALMLENDYPKKSNNIKNYFEIYKIRNRIHGNIEYFVYLNEQASQLSTLNEIKKEEKFSVEPYLLTNKPFNLKDPETRIQNLKKYSGWKKVGFIDDFGKQYLYKEPLEPFSFSKFKSNTIHFIHSLAIVSSGEKHEALTSMDKWFAKDDIPIMVVTGEGGIGKTTLVKEFLNLNLQEEKDYLLFLDSETVISNITTGKILDIYDLYKIIIDEGYKEFNRNLFKLCIDNGTLLVVIDGLDEVVSRLGTRFNLNEFIQSIINNYSFNLTRAKILITCRDSIWNNYKENKSEKVNEIKLLPFTEEQTREYFNETIKVSALAKKAFSFVEKLKTSINENGYFSPFILDTVQRLINQDKDSSNLFTIDPDLSSQYPLDDSSTDFLIIKVLHREAKKNPFWSVEKQIKVFIEISNIDKSGIVKELLEEKIKKNLDIKMEAKDYSSLLSHQFLLEKNTKVFFRYDFFKEFFSIIQISMLINLCDYKIIKCISNGNFSNLGYMNSFTKQIAKKIKINNEEDFNVYFLSLLDSEFLANSAKDYDIDDEDYNADYCSSLMLALYLTILQIKNKLNGSKEMNDIINNFYIASDGKIKNLNIINMNIANIKPKLVFDFCDAIFENCKIKFFSNFLDCNFNAKTKFCNSIIYIGDDIPLDYKGNLSRENFDKDCDLNDNLITLLNSAEQSRQSIFENNEKSFISFLKLFKKHGDFKPQKEDYIRSKKGNLVKVMMELKVIEVNKDSKLNSNEFVINSEYHEELFNYIEQGSPSRFAKDIIKLL